MIQKDNRTLVNTETYQVSCPLRLLFSSVATFGVLIVISLSTVLIADEQTQVVTKTSYDIGINATHIITMLSSFPNSSTNTVIDVFVAHLLLIQMNGQAFGQKVLIS